MSHLDEGAPYPPNTPEGPPDVVPHEKFPEGRIGAPWAAGYCAPAEPLRDAELPTISIKRGGLKWPTEGGAAERQFVQEMERRRQEMVRARKEMYRNLRFALLVFALLYVLTMLADALPWQ